MLLSSRELEGQQRDTAAELKYRNIKVSSRGVCIVLAGRLARARRKQITRFAGFSGFEPPEHAP